MPISRSDNIYYFKYYFREEIHKKKIVFNKHIRRILKEDNILMCIKEKKLKSYGN